MKICGITLKEWLEAGLQVRRQDSIVLLTFASEWLCLGFK